MDDNWVLIIGLALVGLCVAGLGLYSKHEEEKRAARRRDDD